MIEVTDCAWLVSGLRRLGFSIWEALGLGIQARCLVSPLRVPPRLPTLKGGPCLKPSRTSQDPISQP